MQRYSSRFPAVEINSSFYRPHRPATYAKWADSVAGDFRFSVKVPKQITHERRLIDCKGLVDEFLGQCSQLGGKLGCLLIQLPPSLAFEAAVAGAFFKALRDRYQGYAVLEPRHPSWLAPRLPRSCKTNASAVSPPTRRHYPAAINPLAGLAFATTGCTVRHGFTTRPTKTPGWSVSPKH